jgi:hypothetical protein
MRLPRVWSVLSCALLLLLGVTVSAGASTGSGPITSHQHRLQALPPGQNPGETYPTPPPDVVSPIADSDGDGIPDIQDPDDDNGGTSDEDDPAPFDPVIEPTPAPDILSPIEDSDGDGIPNIQDPDDDNDAVQDDEDAAPFVPGTEDPNPPTKAPSKPAPAQGSTSDEAPVVTALPVTGSGQQDSGWNLVWTIAAIGALYVAMGAASAVREHRKRSVTSR